MPKIGDAHPANGDYLFASIDGNQLVYRGPEGLLTGDEVADRFTAPDAEEAQANATKRSSSRKAKIADEDE